MLLTTLGCVTLSARRTDGTSSLVLDGPSKAAALLVYLSACHARRVQRSELVELLWADLSSTDGRHALRQCCWYLRTRTGLALTSTARQLLVLQPEVTTDRDRFLDALAGGDFAEAVRRYTGDFFPDFDAPGAVAFAQWADRERQRLRSRFVDAVGEATAIQTRLGRIPEAVSLARRGRDLAPFEQAAWRTLSEALLAAGDLPGARSAMGSLLLELREAGLSPERETRELHRRLGEPSTASPADEKQQSDRLTLSDGALVGRSVELSHLLAARDASRSGEFTWIHLTAAAGYGKSRLLATFAAVANASRGGKSRTIVLSAVESERHMTYALLGHLVSALVNLRGSNAVSPAVTGTLVAIAPSAAARFAFDRDLTTGDEAVRRKVLAVQELLLATAEEEPIVILLDDTQWIDTPSAEVLRAVFDRLGHCGLLLVTAGRPGDPFASSSQRVQRLPLEPLTTTLVVEWLESVAALPASDWSPALAATLAGVSRGSPLEIALRIESAIDAHILRIEGGCWTSDDATSLFHHVSDSQALERRMANLPEAAAACLLQVAIMGAVVEPDSLEVMLGHDLGQSLRLLEERLLITVDADGLRMSHDEFARVLKEKSPLPLVEEAHRRAALWFLDVRNTRHADRVRAVWHAWKSGDSRLRDRCFARLVEHAKVHGERAQLDALALEVLGRDADPAALDDLLTRLPAALRRSPRRRLGVVLSVVSVVAALLFSYWWSATLRPPSTIELVTVAIGADGIERLVRADVSLAPGDESPIIVEEVAQELQIRNGRPPEALQARLRDGSSLLSQASADPIIGMEIVRVDRSGAVQPFASGPHDQVLPQVAPDGEHVAYLDRRFSNVQNADVIVRRIDADAPVRVTHTEAHEGGVVWHPAGDSVAFFRVHDDRPVTEVCRTSIARVEEQCRKISSRLIVSAILAWSADSKLLLAAQDRTSGRTSLVSVSLRDGRLETIDSSASFYSVDRSGSVALCDCLVPGHDGATPSVIHIESLGRPRPLYFRGDRLRQVFSGPVQWSERNDELARILIVGSDSAAVGSSLQLHVRGIADNGQEAPVMSRRWSSLETRIATVDSTGRIQAHKRGVAHIVVEAAPHIRDTLRLRVVDSISESLLVEDWRAGFADWLTFGTPSPSIETSLQALRLNGDRVYSSGLISRRDFDARGGINLSVLFRLPITRVKWQRLVIALDHVASASQLASWEDRTAGIFASSWSAREARHCTLMLPRGEGGSLRGLAGVRAGGEMVVLDRLPPPFGDGEWHTAQIQVFADGLCAVRIDGVLLGASRRPLRLDLPLRVRLEGASDETQLLIGPIRVWRGLPGGE